MTLAPGPIYMESKKEEAFRDAIEAASRKLLPRLELDDIADYYGSTRAVDLRVLDFLTRYSYLIDTLLEARPHISHIFPTAEVYLEVDEDPEGGFEELFGVISVDASPEDAIRRLDRFDDLWFSRVARGTESRLNFTVDIRNVESL